MATQTWVGQNYLPLSAGISHPLTGDLYLGNNSINLEGTQSPYSISNYIDYQIIGLRRERTGSIAELWAVTIDADSISLDSSYEESGETETHFTEITPSGITIDGNAVATQYWVGQNYLPLTGGTMSNTNKVVNLNADYIDGYDVTSLLKIVTVANNTTNDFNTFDNMTLTGRGDPTTGASLLHAPWTGVGPSGGYGVLTYLWSDYGIQMAWGYSDNHIYIRYKNYSGGVVWSDSWSTVALTSDVPTKTSQLTNDSGFLTSSGSCAYATSAGSATKLQTARTIWGQSFDGTGNVTGNIELLQSNRLYVRKLDWQSYFNSGFLYDPTGDEAFVFATGYSLTRIVFYTKLGLDTYSDGDYNTRTPDLCLYNNNVGIGTNSPSYKLHVNGSAAATSFVNTSDVRWKDIMDYYIELSFECIANAPAIRFTWNQDSGIDDNYKVHVGSIAQYWQTILPEAVTKDDQGYLSMQYDVIALLSAISVAKRVTEHERRIEALERENALLRLELNQIKSAA